MNTPHDQRGDERNMLAMYLNAHRELLLQRCRGLTKEQLAVKVAPSELTLGGLLKHSAFVEDYWFTEMFAGHPMPEPFGSAPFDVDPDWEFHSASDDDPNYLIGLYEAAIGRSNAIYSATSTLDATSAKPRPRNGEPFSLRWVMLHVLEETAQHNGHVDFLRQAIDGTTCDYIAPPR